MGMPTGSLTPSEISTYDESKQTALLASLIVFLVVVNVSVVTRCLSQYWNFRRIYVDDAFVLTAGVFVNVIVGNLLTARHYGLGLHAWRINAEDSQAPHRLSKAFEHVWISMVFQSPCFSAIRICLLYFNRRLFIVQKKWLRVAWWANLGYELLWLVGATGFYAFQCWPPRWYWLQYYARYNQTLPGSIKHGQCRAQTVVHVSTPLFFSLVSDVSILVMPLVALAYLKMTWRRKAAMSALFPVGLLFCLLDVARIIDLWVNTDDKMDPSWGVTNFLIITVAAETTAILRACLPVMMPTILRNGMVIQDYWQLRFGSRRNRHSMLVHAGSRGYKRFGGLEDNEDERPSQHPEMSTHSSQTMGRLHRAYFQNSRNVTSRKSEDNVLVRTDVTVTAEEGHETDEDPFYFPYLSISPKTRHKSPQGMTGMQTV